MSKDTQASNEKAFNGGPNDDASILSFIVRIWREEPSTENKQATWRGHIRPIMGGERSYFRNLDEIPDLINGYLTRTT